MTDRARELVERLRARTVPVMGGAGLYEVVLNERADGLCNEAADFIEQSLTPPVSEGVVERVARALLTVEESWNDHEWEQLPANVQALFRKQARAAIASLSSIPAQQGEVTPEEDK